MCATASPLPAAAALVMLLAAGTAGAEADVAPALASDAAGAPDRGQMLYENHCRGCHVSVVHIRSNRKAASLEAVRWEVARWSSELQLDWRNEEIADVVEYLDREFYRLGLPEAPEAQAGPSERAGAADSDGE